MKLRKSVAAAVLAGAAVFTVAACSSSDDNATTTAATSASSATSSATTAATTLEVPGAQTILDKALNPDTPSSELDSVVDTSNPVTKPALTVYARASHEMGYTYTVKSVRADGDNKAVVTFDVGGPHEAAGIELTFVNVDGVWKLSGDAVTQLSAMARH